MKLAWKDLGLRGELTQIIIDELGFIDPTEIQSLTIPQMLSNKDVLVEATTGSGKTLAFVLPVFEMLSRHNQYNRDRPSVLIISPSRELSVQITSVIDTIITHRHQVKELLNVKSLVVTGGSEVVSDLENLPGVTILIGTPGRLEDLNMRVPDLFKNLEILILDEADRLLDLGFTETLQKILAKAPKQKRVGLFSATLKHTLEDEYSFLCLRNPLRISLGGGVPLLLDNRFLIVKSKDKLSTLLSLLTNEFADKKVMVFFATCAMVDYFSLLLKRLNISVNLLGLHGKMVPKKRTALFKKFCSLNSVVLFCTDLAARGLDFADVDVVIQFDAPKDPRSFVHRCGRTARNGAPGVAVTLLLESEEPFIYLIRNRNIPFNERQPPPDSSFAMNDSLLLSKDRDLFEKSKLAFVSFIRHYREHLAKYIFSLDQLDISGMAKCFCLIQVPKMPELKNLIIELDQIGVDFDAIPFTDAIRESARLEKLAIRKKATKIHIPKNSIKSTLSWSKGKAKKEGKSIFNKSKILNKIKTLQQKIPEVDDYSDLDCDYKEYKKSKRTSKNAATS